MQPWRALTHWLVCLGWLAVPVDHVLARIGISRDIARELADYHAFENRRYLKFELSKYYR
jgi:hypothetical protein